MTLLDEANYATVVGNYVRDLNRRLDAKPASGASWIRVRPPTHEELEDIFQDPRVASFLRVGIVGTVTDVDEGFIMLQVGSDRLVFATESFLDTFIQVLSE